MDYFTPCTQELLRILKRTRCRVQIARAERNLAKAEAHLGLLGWQQADFDQETQRQVDALQNIEREQARLTNLSADIAHEREAVTAQRAKLRETFEQNRRQIEDERQIVRKPLKDLEKKLTNVRSHSPDVERKTAELEKQQRDIEALSNKLLVVQPQPVHVRDEIFRLRDQMLAIQNQRNDLRVQHGRSLSEIHNLENQISGIEKVSADFDRRLRQLREDYEKEDEKLAAEEESRADEKENTERQINALERVKGNPYRAIGRVLADNEIAPMNQPEALNKVQKYREEIADREQYHQSLLDQSKAADKRLLRISLAIWLATIGAGALILSAAF